jgi:hypothetical protein
LWLGLPIDQRIHAPARRRDISFTLAMNSQLTALSMVASTSFARRRLRFDQANVRSTTQRRGSKNKAFGGVGSLDDLQGPVIFSAAYPRGPPDSVVLTDWLPITTPALGLAPRPAASRTSISSTWLIVCHKPLSLQA